MPVSDRSNRGPGAAAENRAALIAAARTIFADRGLHAPLSAVAKEAGVGQGSLYRHFPTRYSLAVAVFQQNVDELETVAADDSATLADLLAAITAQALVSTAFFEMIEFERADVTGLELVARVHSVLSSKVAQAHAAGQLPDRVTTDDVQLGIAMLTGALSKRPLGERAAVAERVWTLLPFGPAT
jgi:AcrR family transcriptional regulator